MYFCNNFRQQSNKDTVTAPCTTSHLSGSMSSAIILSAASVNFFWSTGVATAAVPEIELGLELELGGKEGLGEERSLLDAVVCGGGTSVLCLTFCGSFCFFSFSNLNCSKAKSRKVKLNLPTGNIMQNTKKHLQTLL